MNTPLPLTEKEKAGMRRDIKERRKADDEMLASLKRAEEREKQHEKRK